MFKFPNVFSFPKKDETRISDMLRALADSIDAGDYNTVHSMAFVFDCGGGDMQVGYLGQAAEPPMNTHFLFAMGMRKLELL